MVGEDEDDFFEDFDDDDNHRIEFTDREEAMSTLEASNREKVEKMRSKQGNQAAEQLKRKLKIEMRQRFGSRK